MKQVGIIEREKSNSFKKIFYWIRPSNKAQVEFISIMFIILFLYTALSKLMDIYMFEEQLSESPVFKSIYPIVAWGIPLFEILVSILLFIPKTRFVGLIATIILMTGFTIYVLILLLTSPQLPCSCGGIIELLSWPQHLVLNSILVILAIIATVKQRKLKS